MAWRVARSLQTLIDEVEREFPGTTFWTIGDQDHASRSSDHNPNAQGVVCAVDILGEEQARAVWEFMARTRDPRLKYMIHARLIMSSTISPWTARGYTGSNPHASHLHLSVGRGPDGRTYRSDLYDDPSPWGFSSSTTSSPSEEEEMELIQHIQRSLNAAGVRDKDGDPLEEDGVWGELTESALVAALGQVAVEGPGLQLSSDDLTFLRQFVAQGRKRDARPASLWHVLDWLRDTRTFFSRYFKD